MAYLIIKYIHAERFILRKQSVFTISVKHRFNKTSTPKSAGRLIKITINRCAEYSNIISEER
jgi:hypothetical protein